MLVKRRITKNIEISMCFQRKLMCHDNNDFFEQREIKLNKIILHLIRSLDRLYVYIYNACYWKLNKIYAKIKHNENQQGLE